MESRVKIRVTKSLIRGSKNVDHAVAEAVSRTIGFPSWCYGGSGVIGIDDPITHDLDIVKVHAPRSVQRACAKGFNDGYTNVRPFAFYMPTREVKNHYQVY